MSTQPLSLEGIAGHIEHWGLGWGICKISAVYNSLPTYSRSGYGRNHLQFSNPNGKCRAVYRFGCGAVVSSSWRNSCIFWAKLKYEFGESYLKQIKVAMNLNPEVDVRGGGGRGECNTPNCGHKFDFLQKYTFSLHFLSNRRSNLRKIYFNFISENVYSTHKTYRKFGIFGIWTFYGML